MADTFYIQTGDGEFDSAPSTAGPWSPQAQHAGPPSALLARQIERHDPREGHRLARVSVDILAPIPVAPLSISVESLRQGRRVELLQATASAGGREVAVARAWRLLTTPADLPEARVPDTPGAGEADLSDATTASFPGAYADGYLSVVEWSFEYGGFDEYGPAKGWARPRIPLVEGEEMSGWQRALTIADSGSGISVCAPITEMQAINCDLTVVLDRDPEGEWIGLDSRTTLSAGGGAMTASKVHDLSGAIGTATQTLLAGAV